MTDIVARLHVIRDHLHAGVCGQREVWEQHLDEAAAEIEQLTATLNYVADMTYCGTDAEWHFKPGYDPQTVLDAVKP